MANQITDNRTPIDAADSVTPYDDLSGATAGTLDTEIYIEGSGSIGEYCTNSLAGILYDAGSAQTSWASSVFYLWINCGIVGLLDIKANGGFRIRFAGNTVSDWFEVYVGGNDEWPSATSGGWVQFVVDIETARSTAVTNGWTNGTTPATNACRYVGWAGITTSMPRMADNTWVDSIWRLADGNPGIIVEGQNGGSTDWNFSDILTQIGTGSGALKPGPGGSYVANSPIQFGINDTTTHGFTDTNQIVLWDDQEFAPSDLYGFSALGNSGGTTNVTLGVKTGTGDAATGAQGATIAAATGGVRWAMDFDDPDLDGINFYGCSFIHGGDFQMDDAAVSVISSLYIDCTSATISNSEQLRNSVVNANTADGVAFMTTDDMSDIVFSSFEFSDGHGIELTTPRVASQTSKGNTFTSYGATGTNDAMVYNNSGGAVTISVTDSGTYPITYRNGASASTTVTSSVNVTVIVKDSAGDNLAGVEVAIFQDNAARTVVLASTSTDENGQVATTASASLGAIIIRARQSTDISTFNTGAGVNGTTEVIDTVANHDFQDGDEITYSRNGGTEDIGPEPGTYYVHYISDTTLSLHATAALAISDTSREDLTSTGSETHTLDPERFVAGSATGTIGATDFSAQLSLITDNIATG